MFKSGEKRKDYKNINVRTVGIDLEISEGKKVLKNTKVGITNTL